MRVYRVFPYDPSATPGHAGHATYLPQVQGGGRLDNPGHYTVRYFAESAAGAVGERFGELSRWVPGMFAQPTRGAVERRLALATFDVPRDLRILDLDDAAVLLERGLRPTQVVRRNHDVTQAWALRIHEERTSARSRRPRWDGVRWWSWYRPEWPILGVWEGDVALVDVERLDLGHVAVREAASLLARVLER